MEFYNFKKIRERETYKDKNGRKLKKIEKLINSELTSKIKKITIENYELLIEIDENDLIEVVQFLKSNESCKFRQLIDIAGVIIPMKKNDLN